MCDRKPYRKDWENSLDYLHYVNIISDEQYYAGGDLLRAFRAADLTLNLNRTTMNYGGSYGSSEVDDKGQKERELLYLDAIMAVDPHERQIVRGVVCFGDWIDTKKLKSGRYKFKSEQKIILLKRGLNDLIKHWEKKYNEK